MKALLLCIHHSGHAIGVHIRYTPEAVPTPPPHPPTPPQHPPTPPPPHHTPSPPPPTPTHPPTPHPPRHPPPSTHAPTPPLSTCHQPPPTPYCSSLFWLGVRCLFARQQKEKDLPICRQSLHLQLFRWPPHSCDQAVFMLYLPEQPPFFAGQTVESKAWAFFLCQF